MIFNLFKTVSNDLKVLQVVQDFLFIIVQNRLNSQKANKFLVLEL